jgi:hypothetical protein
MKELEDEIEETEEEEYLYVEVSHESFRPGNQVEGTVEWKFEEPAGSIEVRLLMEVDAKPKRETSYAGGVRWSDLPEAGICKFSLTPPEGPYTFFGKGFQIRWYVEANCDKLAFTDEMQFTYSPTGNPLKLDPEDK